MKNRFFRVTVAEQSDDVRASSLTAIRTNVAGLGWTFVSLVAAPNVAEAEKAFRKLPRFRKTAKQNDADWRSVFVLVEPTTVVEHTVTEGGSV